MPDAGLSPVTLLQLAPNVRTRLDGAGHVLLDAPNGTIVDLGPRGYATLALFVEPIALSDAVERLRGEAPSTDFAPMMNVLNVLIEEGALVQPGADTGQPRGWADPVEHARMLHDDRRTGDYLAALVAAVRRSAAALLPVLDRRDWPHRFDGSRAVRPRAGLDRRPRGDAVRVRGRVRLLAACDAPSSQRGRRVGGAHAGSSALRRRLPGDARVHRLLPRPKIESATQLHGVVGVVTTALFWFYLGGRLIVAGATLNVDSRSCVPASAPRPDGGEWRA